MTWSHTAEVIAAALLVASVLAACAGEERRALVRSRVDEILKAAPGSLALQAEAERVEASLAREGEASVLDGISLRVEDFSPDAARQRGAGIDLETRVSIRNPWATASERRARQAETDAAIAEMEQRSHELRAEDCTARMEAAGFLERQALHDWYEAQLEPLLRWNAEGHSAGVIDELEAERLALEAEVSLEKRRPLHVATPPRVVGPGLALPELGRATKAPLDRRRETILATIDGRHSEAAALRAAARASQALAQRVRRSRLPWLGFVGLSWEFDPENTAGDLMGEATVEIPFGLDLHAEASRHEALGRAETFEADAVVQEAATLAQEALEQVAAFEESSERLLALLERTERAQTLVERWTAGRFGEPRRVAALLEEVFELRLEVIEERARAGLAGCVLLETTGLAISDWPRGREERER
jgi:hypothetical protein